MSYSSTVPSGGGGFPRLLRAEWTKLRSLRSTWICVALTLGLTTLMAYLVGSGNTTNANEVGPQQVFQVQFVRQPLAGDGSIVAHLAEQEETGPEAKAGLMVTRPVRSTGALDRPGAAPDVAFAAIMVTPGHGVQWRTDFFPDVSGSTGPAPRWLKLTRAGSTLTGFESPDGVAWTQVGTTDLAALPRTAEVGMFVTSPPTSLKAVRRSPTSTGSGPDYALGAPRCSTRSASPAPGARRSPGAWRSLDAGAPRELPNDLVAGSFTENDGRFTVSGAGDLGVRQPGELADDDVVRDSLGGILIGFIAIAVVAALFITTEFRRGIIRTTFTASPHRGRVLIAKAVVVAGVAFVTGTVAAAVAFLVSQPLLRANGFVPPAYPKVFLWDAPVVRAVVGTGLVLALLAVLALALGASLGHGAAAITLVIALVVLPFVIGPFLTLDGEAWLKRVTPVAGLAIQQTRDRFDDVIGPWPGIAVLGAWVAVALVAAVVLLRRRDA